MDAWWLDQSQARQQAVCELLTWMAASQEEQTPLIVCGDFNADPDSDEIRMPDRRIDYIFCAAPRRGGAGHPVEAALLGVRPVAGACASDHYAVQASLRY